MNCLHNPNMHNALCLTLMDICSQNYSLHETRVRPENYNKSVKKSIKFHLFPFLETRTLTNIVTKSPSLNLTQGYALQIYENKVLRTIFGFKTDELFRNEEY
jgi:hypothetical protein